MSESTVPYASRQIGGGPTFLGHPVGLFLLFFVEMWERFSYYGMRALLVLYLVRTAQDGGRGWDKSAADGLYGWYTGMAYLLPILGGLIADKIMGTHRSLIVGGSVIALGHMVLAMSGIGELAHSHMGMTLFIMGLVLIVVGTGHFKPNVSVMVNRMYPAGDARQDGAFTIFYMGINVGAFIGPLVCGYLGEKVGWHWGFGAAAVGMILGLIAYIAIRPKLLAGIGEGPATRQGYAWLVWVISVGIAVIVAALYNYGALGSLGAAFDWFVGLSPRLILVGFIVAIIAMCAAFVSIQKKGDGGPVACILVFVLFNAIFWLAYEQAGSSLDHFADEMTNLNIGSWQMPASWFQSVPALMVVVLAPVFAGLWIYLARWNRNPSQAVKLAMGLFLVGGGYVFMVIGSNGALPKSHSASMFWLTMTYLMHTFGELCMSPTGLSFVTKVAPARSVSLLMGIWFLSNAVANKVGGQVAGKVDAIASGDIVLPWAGWFAKDSQAPFFLFFVILSVGAGVVMSVLTPLLNGLLKKPAEPTGFSVGTRST